MKTNSFNYINGTKEIVKDKKRLAVKIEKRLKREGDKQWIKH